MGARRNDDERDLGRARPSPSALGDAEVTELIQAPIFDDEAEDERRPVLPLEGELTEDGPTDSAAAPHRPRPSRLPPLPQVEAPAASALGAHPSRSRVPMGSVRPVVERTRGLGADDPAGGRASSSPPDASLRLPLPAAETGLRLPLPGGAPKQPSRAPEGGSRPAALAAEAGPRASLAPPAARPEPPDAADLAPRLRAAEAAAAQGARALRLGMPLLAGVLLLIVGVFAWSVRRSPPTAARARTAGSSAASAQRGGEATPHRSYKDEVQAANPELVVRSPLPLPAGAEPARTAQLGVLPGSAPKARRRGGLAVEWGFRQPTDGAKAGELRYGFEVPERPKKRDYETSEAAPAGAPPMLMVFTDPPGVAVDVDGKLYGVTPLLRPVPKDKTAIDVRLWGGAYLDQRYTLKPGKNGHFQLGATMEAKPRPRLEAGGERPTFGASAGPARKEPDPQEPTLPPPPAVDEAPR